MCSVPGFQSIIYVCVGELLMFDGWLFISFSGILHLREYIRSSSWDSWVSDYIEEFVYCIRTDVWSFLFRIILNKPYNMHTANR